MNITKIMDRVLFTLSVPKCVCCRNKLDYGDKALCLKCSTAFNDFKTRNCSMCGRMLNECDCSNEFLSAHYMKRVIKCYRYLTRDDMSPANSLIYSLKRDNRSDVLDVCTDELATAITNSIVDPENYIFTNIPRRRAALVEYGIDHSALLAKALAKRFGAEYRSMLASKAKKAQKSLETDERFKNADFYIRHDIDLSGRKVIIVDDIITTGASMGKAAAMIRSLGSKEIIGASLAIAYKDK